MPYRRSAVTLTLVLTLFALAPDGAHAAQGERWQGLPLWGGPVQVAAAPAAPEVVYAATATPGVYRSRDGGRSWRLSGGGPRGFRAEILAVDPHDPRRLFAAGYDDFSYRGLFRSDDEGRRWTRVDQGMGMPFVSDVDFDSATPGRVYAATGAGLFRAGLYRSEDHGATWTPLPFERGVAAMAVDPAAPRIVLATATLPPDRRTIFRSADGGQTFAPVHEAIVEEFVFDLSRPGRVYGWNAAAVLRSDDHGATWTALPAPFYVLSLAVGRGGVLFVGTYEWGVRRSSDGGQTWEPAPEGSFATRRAPRDSISSFAVVADALLAAGDRGVWRGTPEGRRWKASSDGVRGQAIGALAVAADEASTVWVGATGGFFQSRDEGATFRIRPVRIGLLALHPLVPETAYAFGASEDGAQAGLLKTEDGGAIWRVLPYTGVDREIFVLEVDPLDPDVVYAGGEFEPHGSPCTAVRSTDGGETWTCIAPGLLGFYSLAIDPQDPRTLYARFFDGLYRSRDRGSSWTRQPARGLSIGWFLLRADPFVSGRIYAFGGPGVHRSDDGGRTFRSASRGLPANEQVLDLLADPARPGRLYAAVVTFGRPGGGVYRSDDAGESWRRISAGLPEDAVVVRLAADPRGADIVYAGTAGKSLYRLRVAD